MVVLSSSCSARMSGDRDAVGDEVLAGHPLLTPVRGRAEAERPVDQLEVEPVGVALQHGAQVGGARSGSGSGHSSPAVAKLRKRSPAMMTWSYTGTSSSRPAATSCRVTARSSARGSDPRSGDCGPR